MLFYTKIVIFYICARHLTTSVYNVQNRANIIKTRKSSFLPEKSKKGKNALHSVEYAVAAAVLAHSTEGDYMLCSEEEVMNLVKNGSAKVQR